MMDVKKQLDEVYALSRLIDMLLEELEAKAAAVDKHVFTPPRHRIH